VTDVFALAPRESEERTQFAQDNLLDPAALPPPAWRGLAEQPKRLLRQSAKAGRTLTMAGAPFAQGVDQAGQVFSDASDVLSMFRYPGWRPSGDTPRTAAQDWYFRNVVDELGTEAVNYWTPDAATTGSAANMVGTVLEVAGSIPQMIGTPSLFLADSGFSPAVDTINQGGDAATGAKVGAINLAANALGMRLPAALGKTLPTRIATGAGMNVAVGVAAGAGSEAVLEDAGLTEYAAAYDPFNMESLTLDALMGAAFGWRAHLDAPPLSPSQRTAVLVANNAHHADTELLPGQPRDATAAAQHRAALDTAVGQLMRDQRVNVALDAAGFELRPELTAAPRAVPEVDGYEAMLVRLESGGRADAKAPTSSATGLHQFTRDTWLRVFKREVPDSGMSDDAILALRTDPEISGRMERALRAENAAALESAGLPVDAMNLYAMHHFGGTRGKAFAAADDATPMADILTAEQLAANKYLQGKTKGEAIAIWTERAGAAPARAVTPVEPPGLFDFTQERGRVKIGDASISYRRDGDEVSLDLIATPPKARGQGAARTALEAFIADADAQGVRTKLIVAEQGAKVDPARLARFYESAGFRRVGETEDGSPRMVREPQRAAEAVRPPEAQAPDPDRVAADAALAEFPDLQVMDDDGNLRSARELLDELDATAVETDTMAKAIDAAATCFLRTHA